MPHLEIFFWPFGHYYLWYCMTDYYAVYNRKYSEVNLFKLKLSNEYMIYIDIFNQSRIFCNLLDA